MAFQGARTRTTMERKLPAGASASQGATGRERSLRVPSATGAAPHDQTVSVGKGEGSLTSSSSTTTPRGSTRGTSFGRTMSWRRHSSLAGLAAKNSMSHRRRASSSVVDDEDGASHDIRRQRADTGGFTTAGSSSWDAPLPPPETMNYEDVRDELEMSGHNLTSVLNNPRETFMDSLYEAAFETTAFETEPHPASLLDMANSVLPQGLREITAQVRLHVYIQSTVVEL